MISPNTALTTDTVTFKVTPQPPQQAILPGIAIADTVEHYAYLQKQIRELQLKLDESKQMIVSFCQSEGLNQAYGSENAITCKFMERTGFSENEVRALLEPEGLWDRVLNLDQSRLKQLPTDDEVAEDIRYKLEALRQVIATYPQLWVKKIIEEEQTIFSE